MTTPPPDLERLAQLTRRYADCSRDAAGLATLWGGALFLFLAGMGLGIGLKGLEQVEATQGLGAALRQLFRSGYPAPFAFRVMLTFTPLVWFVGWSWLGYLSRRRFGRVTSVPEPLSRLFLALLGTACIADGAYSALRPWLWSLSVDPLARWAPLAMSLAGALMLWTLRKEATIEGGGTLMILLLSSMSLVSKGISDAWLLLLAGFLVLAVAYLVLGGLRFAGYLKVARELDALGGRDGAA